MIYKKRSEEKTLSCAAIDKEIIEVINVLLMVENINVNIVYKCKQSYKYEEKTELYLAFEKNNDEIVKLLLMNKNIDVNIPYKNCYFKDPESYMEGKYEEKYERTLLYRAIENNNNELNKLLLTNENIDINYINKERTSYEYEEKTALHLAVNKSFIVT